MQISVSLCININCWFEELIELLSCFIKKIIILKPEILKAAINKIYGPPEAVSVTEVEKPLPKQDEVLVIVHVATVNRTDCGFRSAEYFISRFFSGLFKPKFETLGNEFAGVVEAVGDKVRLFKVGDKVFGYNDVTFGAHAEYLAISENDNIVLMPPELSFKTVACISEGGHYALSDIRAANVKADDKVLVNGATGAIGSAAVQLCLSFGANVTAVCATPNVENVKAMGANKVVDYLLEDFTKTDEKYDFIFDAVGKSSYGKCKPLLKEKGIYISTELGKNAENIFLALFTPILGQKRVLFLMPHVSKDDLLFLKDLVEKGEFNPLIDREFKLDQIVEAYKYVETGQKIGNVLITVV